MINPQGRVSTRSAIPSARSLGDRPWCPMMDAWRCCWMVSRPCWNKIERQKWCPLWLGSPWLWLTWQFGEPWDGFQVVWLMAFLALMCSSFPSCGHCTARWTDCRDLRNGRPKTRSTMHASDKGIRTLCSPLNRSVEIWPLSCAKAMHLKHSKTMSKWDNFHPH